MCQLQVCPYSLWVQVLSDSWFPCSSELQFRDEIFKEYLWLGYSKRVAKNLPGVLFNIFSSIHLRAFQPEASHTINQSLFGRY